MLVSFGGRNSLEEAQRQAVNQNLRGAASRGLRLADLDAAGELDDASSSDAAVRGSLAGTGHTGADGHLAPSPCWGRKWCLCKYIKMLLGFFWGRRGSWGVGLGNLRE